MRYARVEAVISKEPALRRVLAASVKDVTVFKPNGEQQQFNKEVLAVTDAIHDDGLDAHTLSNGGIIDYAAKVLLSGKPIKFNKPERGLDRSEQAEQKKAVAKLAKAKIPAPPVLPPPPKIKAAKSKAISVRKPQAESQGNPAPKPHQSAAPPPPPPPPLPLEPEPEPEGSSPKAESVAAPISLSAIDEKDSERAIRASFSQPSYEIPRQTADGVIGYYPAVSCVSMLVSISQLLEHFMAPGSQRDEIITRADKLIIDVKKMAIIPKPSAKENPPAAAVVD